MDILAAGGAETDILYILYTKKLDKGLRLHAVVSKNDAQLDDTAIRKLAVDLNGGRYLCSDN